LQKLAKRHQRTSDRPLEMGDAVDGAADGDGPRAAVAAAPVVGAAALPPFALERFFAKHEFTARHLLCCSDCEPWTVRDLLTAAGKGNEAESALLDLRPGYTETRGLPALRAAIAGLYPPPSPATCRRSTPPRARARRPSGPDAPRRAFFWRRRPWRCGRARPWSRPGRDTSRSTPWRRAAARACWRGVHDRRLRRRQGAQMAAARTAARTAAGGGRLAFDARDLEALLRPLIDAPDDDGPDPPPLLRAVLVNLVCHNPTGSLATDALWGRVADLLTQAGAAQRRRAAARGLAPPPPIVLFSDEMYARMEPWRDGGRSDDGGGTNDGGGADVGGGPAEEPLPPPPPPRVSTALDLISSDGGFSPVVLCGLSKSWGCPGLRLGWLATRSAPGFLDRVSELRDYTTICSPAPCERLALAAVGATEFLTRAARRRVAGNARLAADFFGRRWRRAFEWPGAPDAGPVCFPAARPALVEAAGAADVSALCDLLAARAGVLLLPATVYADDGGGGGGEEEEGRQATALLAGRFRLGLGRDGLRAFGRAWLVKVVGVAGALSPCAENTNVG